MDEREGVPAATPGEPRDLATVREVLQRRGDELERKLEGVQAMAPGNAPGWLHVTEEDAAYVIDVFVGAVGNLRTDAVSVDGVPLRFKVSGPFYSRFTEHPRPED